MALAPVGRLLLLLRHLRVLTAHGILLRPITTIADSTTGAANYASHTPGPRRTMCVTASSALYCGFAVGSLWVHAAQAPLELKATAHIHSEVEVAVR